MSNFPDISHYQGSINFDALRHSGVDAVIIKATEGVGNTDDHYRANVSAARAAGFAKIGHYHFADLTQPATTQAARFLATVGTPRPGDALILDVENSSGTSGVSANRLWVQTFMAVCRRSVGGSVSRVWVYTNMSTWNGNLGGWTFDAPLWFAGDAPSHPTGLGKPILWQNGYARFAGISSPADCNVPQTDLTPYFGLAPARPTVVPTAHQIHANRLARAAAAAKAHAAHLAHVLHLRRKP